MIGLRDQLNHREKNNSKVKSKASGAVGNKPRLCLRERKKQRTRAEIQKQALRLFRKQGFYATTVEQIAEAAEVSSSTFFRYFPTKDDVVLWDDLDPLLIAAFKSRPRSERPIKAFREAMREVVTALPAEKMAEQRQRTELILTVPELQARMLTQFSETMKMLADALAEREKLDENDFRVVNLSGALIGVMMSVLMEAAADPKADLFELADAGLAHLEAGLPL